MIEPIPLVLEGTRLELIVDFNALRAFERLSGKNALREWTWEFLSASDILFLIYAAANRWDWNEDFRQVPYGGEERVTLRDLGAMMNLSNLEAVQSTLQVLYGISFPEPQEKGGDAGAGEDPPSPSHGGTSGPSGDTTSDSEPESSGA